MAGRTPKFSIGEFVMVQIPGSKLEFRGKVIHNTGSYEVELENGSRRKVMYSNMNPISAYNRDSKSPGRRGSSPAVKKTPASTKKSPRRSRSPRQQSRSRSRGRNRSASTRKVSPSRSRTPNKTARQTLTSESQTKTVVVTKQVENKEEKKTALTNTTAATSEVVKNSVEPSSGFAFRSVQRTTTNSREGLRNRVFEANDEQTVSRSSARLAALQSPARLAALQSARVAVIATPELILDNDSIMKTKEDFKDHKLGKPNGRHFGGPIGTFFFIFTLPVLVLAINLMCTKESCTVLKLPRIPSRLFDYFDLKASGIYLGWVLFQALLYALPIGRLVEGQPLVDGTRLKYRINGFFSFVVSLAAVAGLLYYYDNAAAMIHFKWLPMLVTSIIFSYILALLLYIKARWAPPYALALHGNSGNFLYDFFMGKELNPRPLGCFELKMFLELRPGVIGWAALNVCFLFKDFNEHGTLSAALALSVFCQMLYVADALYLEEAILSTMDVTTEGLGLMLVFGDLTFVPFFFTMQSRYLVDHRIDLPWYFLAGCLILNLFGYYVFRASNLQKDRFRTNRFHPSVTNLETIPTGLPKEILAGGWWGWLRHPNYFGDLLMALAWCLPGGFDHLLPFSYFVYLFFLLCHRAVRDDYFCHRKYGVAWDKYCQRVRHRIFPKVF